MIGHCKSQNLRALARKRRRYRENLEANLAACGTPCCPLQNGYGSKQPEKAFQINDLGG
jgi:hypothetical protein